MTKEELAALLDGREYGSEISQAESDKACDDGLVVVFGYGDDGMEFRGAIHDECGVSDGTIVRIDRVGVFQDTRTPLDVVTRYTTWEALESIVLHRKNARKITVRDDDCWFYETDIPHATFTIYDEDVPYCRGIVFSLDDL